MLMEKERYRWFLAWSGKSRRQNRRKDNFYLATVPPLDTLDTHMRQ